MVISVEDARLAARRGVPRWLFDYVDGGSGAEATLRRNIAALARLGFLPSVLRGAASPDTGTTLFGIPHRFPVILAPVGMAGMLSPGGEISAAIAATRAGLSMCVSHFALASIEDVAAAVDPARLMFQLYLFRDRAVTRDMVVRAWAAGVRTLVVTVDTPVTPLRPRDARNGFRGSTHLSGRLATQCLLRPRWLYGALRRPNRIIRNLAPYGMGDTLFAQAAAIGRAIDPAIGWDDIAALRESWKGRLVVKGLLRPDDTERAAAAGLDGVILSNHGGRQLDGAVSSIETLAACRAAVGGRIELCVDGGFRHGADVVKALALGAHGVLIGRPWAYGLAAGGIEGVTDILTLFHDGIRSSMTLLGAPDIADLREARCDRLASITDK
ncbi:FMN-dependent L-lactate dehydrogenase [Gluconacetobacter sacchari DSM 12717]|uniref:Alpha-hydroxy-acid oxidizing protein n=2 Tax=Gluconacetobacter sacchari TaxID=92759 RepID=A0A7W4ICV5_9PROT|nr:alpha-hydroxy acid oxidase [Gluconacetobacter sacchari]MBB2160524.1 alpha-hydroxy-acid oxidizing protein [Gluconacetobacter sacchari]GBQ32942.1 FMN-dependent L-lactate dehydrogenase [Gluconacetobacter sacchari DSM 12717]